MPDEALNDLQPWDLSPVVELLTVSSEFAAETAWTSAQPALYERFPQDVWTATYDVNLYGTGAHSNLYNNECQQAFKSWLEDHGVDVEAYARAVGPVQYVSIQLHLNTLLERARGNKGWRVRIIHFPALQIVGCGLASHYQGTQNHNQMGEASSRIRVRALEILTGTNKAVLEEFPSATASDWEERGLMEHPVLTIGPLDISSFDDGRGAKLRFIRNTTVKKELATFFALRGMTLRDFSDGRGASTLERLRDVAIELGSPTAS